MAINNAKRQWEVMQGGLMQRSSRVIKQAMPDLYATHVAATVANDVMDDEDRHTMSSSSRSRLVRLYLQQQCLCIE